MEDRLEFLARLEEALLQRRAYLNERQVPRLKDAFHAHQSALKGVLNLLLRKSLIKEDPYKHEQKISELTVPSSEAVLESEKIEEISLRLSDLETQLDYLNNFYQFSADFLNLSRVRLLSRLVKYITWEKLTEMSGSINTKLVAELFSKVRLGGDKLSTSVLNDAQNQLVKSTNEILEVLRELTSFHREQYKLEMRKRLFAGPAIDDESVASRREEVLRQLKARFIQLSSGTRTPSGEGLDRGTPYYPELIAEILDEDHSEYGPNLKLGILEKLQVRDDRRPVRTKAPELKPILLEALRLVGTAGLPLESALSKLLDNAQLLEQKKLSLGARIRLWFIRLVRNEPPHRTYEIELSDPETAITRLERLDFKAYSQRALKRCKVLEGISNRIGPTFVKLAESDEEQIYRFLSSNLDEVHALYSKMPALDSYFKAKLGNEERSRLKGIKMEINAIKNAVVKSNQRMHEYVSRKEEEEQLRRLGIADAPPE